MSFMWKAPNSSDLSDLQVENHLNAKRENFDNKIYLFLFKKHSVKGQIRIF